MKDNENLTTELRVLIYVRLRVEQTKRVPPLHEIGDYLNLPHEDIAHAMNTVTAWLVLTSERNINTVIESGGKLCV